MADTKTSAETLVSAIAPTYRFYIVSDTGTAPDSGAATASQIKDFMSTYLGVMNDTGASLVEAAVQSEMEAGSSTTLAVTPGRQHYHPSAAKCWLKCGVTGSVVVSYNITSITDTGTGVVTVTIATDFSTANYAVVASVEDAADNVRICDIRSEAAGSFIGTSYTAAGAAADPNANWFFVAFGDQ